jgi:membrane protein
MWRHGSDLELMQRSLSFAALGFTTLVPLLIVVAAATALRGDADFPAWVVAGIGLSGRSAAAVRQLFSPGQRVLSTTSALGAAGLGFFGLSLADCVKRAFERVWELPSSRGLRSVWRQVVWLAVLVGYLLAMADLALIGHSSWLRLVARGTASALASTAFFWWTAKFLLDGRVGWRPLLPGAVLTVAGLSGLRLTSNLFFAPSIVSGAVNYGKIGTVLIIVSWLIGVGYVVFGGALAGRHLFCRSRIARVREPRTDPVAEG